MVKADYLQRLKDRTDVVYVIGLFLPLKKHGSNYRGCCPFHNEKTPSFYVNPVRRSYKCFGCGASGDALEFLQQHKKLTFPEAVEYLAGLLHDTVEYESSNRPKSRFDGIRL